MWHVTDEMWHVTRDIWHVTGGGRWTFSQNVTSLALTAWEWRFVEDLKEKGKGVSDFMTYKGVCRAAPATPGLLTNKLMFVRVYLDSEFLKPINFQELLYFKSHGTYKQTEQSQHLTTKSFINLQFLQKLNSQKPFRGRDSLASLSSHQRGRSSP